MTYNVFGGTLNLALSIYLTYERMPYNTVADGFHTKKLCSRLSSSEVRFYTENGRFAVFSLPPTRRLGQRTMFILGSL